MYDNSIQRRKGKISGPRKSLPTVDSEVHIGGLCASENFRKNDKGMKFTKNPGFGLKAEIYVANKLFASHGSNIFDDYEKMPLVGWRGYSVDPIK